MSLEDFVKKLNNKGYVSGYTKAWFRKFTYTSNLDNMAECQKNVLFIISLIFFQKNILHFSIQQPYGEYI